MTTPLVKICGLTRPEDAAEAVRLGASFTGLIFAEESKRKVTMAEAEKIADAVRSESETVRLVGVFVNESVEQINERVEMLGLDLVQLHGEEAPEVAERLSKPVIRAVRVRDETTDLVPAGRYEWLLYDSWTVEKRGGSGVRFDWQLLGQRRLEGRVMLSGGLDPDNVEEAIDLVRPDAVDVASGVESSPGVKNHEKMRAFMERVKNG